MGRWCLFRFRISLKLSYLTQGALGVLPRLLMRLIGQNNWIRKPSLVLPLCLILTLELNGYLDEFLINVKLPHRWSEGWVNELLLQLVPLDSLEERVVHYILDSICVP